MEAIPGRLELIDKMFRGFAYEGCAMGLAVADPLSLRPWRMSRFVTGVGANHVYIQDRFPVAAVAS